MFGIDRFYLGYPAIGKIHRCAHTLAETFTCLMWTWKNVRNIFGTLLCSMHTEKANLLKHEKKKRTAGSNGN